MIGQYLPNNNETATVAFRQKFYQLNSLQARSTGATAHLHSPAKIAGSQASHHPLSLFLKPILQALLPPSLAISSSQDPINLSVSSKGSSTLRIQAKYTAAGTLKCAKQINTRNIYIIIITRT
jgi:hypothetical protein